MKAAIKTKLEGIINKCQIRLVTVTDTNFKNEPGMSVDEAIASISAVVVEYAKEAKFPVDSGDQFMSDFEAIDYNQVFIDWSVEPETPTKG